MTTLSVYRFNRDFPQWAGVFSATHVRHQRWAVASFTNMTQGSVMGRVRPDNEAVWRVNETLNAPFVLSEIDDSLGDTASRNGAVFTTYAITANRNLMGNLVLFVQIPIAVNTPWFCFNTTADIRYWFSLSLEDGVFAAALGGSDYVLHGWTGACEPQVNQALAAGATNGEGAIAQAFDGFAAIFNANGPFRALYFLPGDARTTGTEVGDADREVAVAAVPR